MSPYQRNQKDKKRKNLYRKIHRWIGFSSALFLLNLAITGILLNHSDDLNLHKKHITSTWLINWFGITAPDNFECAQLSNNLTQFCQVGSTIYKGNSPLIRTTQKLIGLIELDELIYIATENEIIIYTKAFELVERLNFVNGLPSSISKVGTIFVNDLQYLSYSNNQKTWFFKAEQNIWQTSVLEMNASPKLKPSNNNALAELQTNYLNNKISYLKLVQDIHSGRILNLTGKIFTDLSGIVIILLSISGFIAWKKRTKQ